MKLRPNTRAVTLATLVMALGAAVYMNWSLAGQTPQASVPADTAADGQAVAVFDPLETGTAAETADAAAEQAKNYGEAQLVSASQDSSVEFFEQARLTRTKARDEALDSIKKALKNADLDKAEKEQLTADLQAQVSSITAESELESKIKAKGFADCVVTLRDGRADITVMTENDALTQEEVTRIRDVVLNSCEDISAQDITITEVK